MRRLIPLIFLSLALVLDVAHGRGCGVDEQKRAAPLPSKYDSNWFDDVDKLVTALPKGPPILQIVSEKQANEIFKELAGHTEIPFNYPQEGCYARAHVMSRLLESKGIISEKVFLEGNLLAATPETPTGYVRWQYHVATSIDVKLATGQVVRRVIDPSLFDRPATVDEWIERQTRLENSRKKTKHYFRTRYTYWPYTKDLHEWDDEHVKHAEDTIKSFTAIKKQLQEKAKKQ